ncbi:DUF3570 domain-containing protein [Methylomonas rapida]|uniref:DUF3570 domain-containing protein n=1 Tax=Methylomonas rapida TaxID=2963939 RepID=A0ABY7GPP6_9GAMM|nr:DUF3570 domain-containing protein [Methylomonas rapida]WAR46473.1 DUF3570 domain-containing protein [Methylomonas rapida]
MAATKVEKNAALAALTSAALSLPGLQAVAAVPAANINANVSYGHYEENNNRMKVDVYHADAVIPLTDRIELSFSLDRDTYSGATPMYSLPVTLTNLPRQEKSKIIYEDLVSSASPIVTKSNILTFGLDTFYTESGSTIANVISNSQDQISNNRITLQSQINDNHQNDLKSLDFNLYQAQIYVETEYTNTFDSIVGPFIASMRQQRDNDIALYNQQKTNDLATYQASHPEPSSIKTSTTVNFEGVLTAGAYYGKASDSPISGGLCPGGDCISQNGIIVGTINDITGPNAHLHQGGTTSNRALTYHNDSGGIYIRALDSSAFSLDSIKINSPYKGENPYAKFLADGVTPNPDHDPSVDYFEILGFNQATNTNLAEPTLSGKCTDYASCVAYQTIYNGFVGTLPLNSGFRNIKAAWLHYANINNTGKATFNFALEIDDIAVSPVSAWLSWNTDLTQFKANLDSQYQTLINNRKAQFESDLAAQNLSPEQNAAIDAAASKKNETIESLTKQYQADIANLNKEKEDAFRDVEQLVENLKFQAKVDAYRSLLDSMVPTNTPIVQRFALQPMETRSMPQFTTRYFFDDTTLSLSGGLSDEPDFLSNFGSVNVSHEFNDKSTTVFGGYGVTSNDINRSTGHAASGHSHDEAAPNYPDLKETSTFHNFNLGLSQVLGKNTLFQTSANYSHQQGYLSNPYKYVYIRGEITPEEYALLESADEDFNWGQLTSLEMVGIELFRENRPSQRNIFSTSNRLNQHIPELDASVHFDYRFYTDDWNINSHTFELKWFQSLPGGFTVTPSLRYYSQSEAEFFAPYFLAPRADGYYSSDFRLSAFGNLTPGITITKEFARGITLETGFEYTFHSGGLKLGGGGVGDYADFEYFMAHANLNIDFAARPFSMGGGAGDHHMHHHHHHGAPIPAGVMFGHMMSQADEIMVGYRYQYGVQSGSMLHGSDQISDALLVSNACAVSDGCLYKPTKMHMQMHMLDLMYSPTDWLTLMIMPQLMSMDMTMSDSLQPGNEGEHGGSKHTSNDIGDTLAVAMVKLMDDGTHHVHAGIGMSAPTGAIDAEISQGRLKDNGASTERETGTAVLQDYGMQLGSGTWDFKPSLTYTGHIDDWGWGGQLNGTKRLQKNEYGYAYGDIFQATGWGSYNIFNWLSATIRGVYTWQDRIRGETNQTHETTSPVDFPANYGGRFWDVGFGLNASIPEGRFAGNNFSVEWLQPVATDFNGYQLDRDGALTATWSFSF